MTKIGVYSERFAATGAADARVTKRAMGKSHVPFWQLFLRETLQNSWDARTGDAIEFTVNAARLDPRRSELLRDTIFREHPADPAVAGTLRASLDSRATRILTVTDHKTRGLGGPTRADIADPSSGNTHFVDFVRNIGRARKKGYAGGTYGLGKGVLFTASSAATCVVYTQTMHEGFVTPRLIAMCVSDDSYRHSGILHTGRHWWGNTDSEIVEPIVGAPARALAIDLGITPLRAEELGTSITVIDPALRFADSTDKPADTDEKIVAQISEAARRWAWPHMVDAGSGPSIKFSFVVNGNELQIVPPQNDSYLGPFVAAYLLANSSRDGEPPRNTHPFTVEPIVGTRLKENKRLGTLSYTQEDRTIIGTEKDSSEIALMREPRFVVKYLPISDTSRYRVRGVFLAHPSNDEAFAQSEPVAHDDWNPQNLELEARARNPVRIALKHIGERFREISRGTPPPSASEDQGGVTAVSRALGSALSSALGTGAEYKRSRTSTSRPRPSAPKTYRVTMSAPPVLQHDGRGLTISFPFTVQTGPDFTASGELLRAIAQVLLDDGRPEVDPPIGASGPEILGWFRGETLISAADEVALSDVLGGEHRVLVAPPPNTSVALGIEQVKR
ncbi:hypothetical protein SAMN05216410_0479 [Sanguibacter gelidistatuariae]|uniref:Histidine kinase-, DNA gyrase B-, and HSP90-like ATPase n=1 Tax=Sanguibacter gelidistatuariae TaxID=1814289 RepID=A0A1G6GU74_9MICO|nr:hypothetical protein [Sanguibacter gelidistatuariae]SDB85572.1 hypothetical protein SAMN05216410_0479 [Sanguibacter gelidistatuariae]